MTWGSLRHKITAVALAALFVAALSGTALADDVAASTNDTETESAQESADNANTSTLNLDSGQNAVKEDQVPDSSFIYDTSLTDLANADLYYDGMTVQVVGEAVGDIIAEEAIESDFRWVTLWENSETIVVYMNENDAALIDTLGSAHRTGTKLQVRGVFNLTCSEHNGISDLHAENVTVQEKGAANTSVFRAADFAPGLIAIAIGLGLMALFTRLRDRDV